MKKAEGLQAVILAGGRGRRLLPYTTVLPKPLMPIGEYPILEVILRQLNGPASPTSVICTGHLHEIIRAYLAQSRHPGLSIRFTHEEEPLGTIGPLRLIDHLADTFLVMNGDILTDLDYRKLVEAHGEKKGMATIATYHREVNVDFGVLEHDGEGRIRAFREKAHLLVRCLHGDLRLPEGDPRLCPRGDAIRVRRAHARHDRGGCPGLLPPAPRVLARYRTAR